MKESAMTELLKANNKVSSGGKYVSVPPTEKMIFQLNSFKKQSHERLSNREFQVLCRIANGKSLKSIAVELCVSGKTVTEYRRRIMGKLKMSNNSDLIRYALENKLV